MCIYILGKKQTRKIKMKLFILFATALLVVTAHPTQQDWTSFKAKHGKSYTTLEEERVRFEIFQDNVQKINTHNARYEAGLETYAMAVNKFADLIPKEFGAMLRRINGPIPRTTLTSHVQSITAPEAMDWRQTNAVLEVKDQGDDCDSSWAFSSTGALEGQNAIKNNVIVPLSAQQLVDCDSEVNKGCDGGDILTAFEYVIKHGLNSEDEYPYEAVDGSCRAKSGSVVQVKEVVSVEATESALRDTVGTVGPVSIALYSDPFQFYFDGVFDDTSCFNDADLLNHSVLVVAYGNENGTEYWDVKNSWGVEWGNDGYMRVVRNKGMCGIGLYSAYPILA
ncbi:unnamed protein product [Psylliodes chrysocephalus]|uniref:Uncharacterized protein n=1 Tax=Psylliodes chrysocephalus TaxID=3402493 RepID=A0A9P0GA38_9CUCU|nr:unnamed protein product [Psylliodes chrysocephala]